MASVCTALQGRVWFFFLVEVTVVLNRNYNKHYETQRRDYFSDIEACLGRGLQALCHNHGKTASPIVIQASGFMTNNVAKCQKHPERKRQGSGTA